MPPERCSIRMSRLGENWVERKFPVSGGKAGDAAGLVLAGGDALFSETIFAGGLSVF